MLADDLFSKSDCLSFRPDYYSRVTWTLLFSRYARDDLLSKSHTLSFRPDYYSRVTWTQLNTPVYNLRVTWKLLISRYARRRLIFEITLSFRPDYYSRVSWTLLISWYACRRLIFEIWHFEVSTCLPFKGDLKTAHFEICSQTTYFRNLTFWGFDLFTI